MKRLIPIWMVLVFAAHGSIAQPSSTEQEIRQLSTTKWRLMAEQKADSLALLFHDQSRFVHMSGTWGKEAEVEIIRSGRIHYKQADVHDVVVEVDGDTAVLWNRITLHAVVGGNDVTTEFTVTEVYKQASTDWLLLALTFSSVRDTHALEH